MYILENIFLHDKKYPLTYSRIKKDLATMMSLNVTHFSPLFDILAYLEKIF